MPNKPSSDPDGGAKELTRNLPALDFAHDLLPSQAFADPAPSSDLFEYVRVIRRRKGIVIVMGLAGALLGLLTLLPKTPVYQASSEIEIQPLAPDLLSKDGVQSVSSDTNPELDLMTQVKILETGALQSRVIAKMQADPGLRIQSPKDRLAAWRKVLHLREPAAQSRESMLAAAGDSIQIKASPTARVIDIFCSSGDPKLAAAFANTMASEFIDLTLESRWKATEHTGEWLSRQLDEMKVKLEKSEDQLQGYANAMHLVFTGEEDKSKANVSDEKLRQLQAELSAAQGQRVALEARNELANSGHMEALAQVLDDPELRSDDGKLGDLRRQLAELSSTLTPEHYKVKRVEAQIAEMEAERKKTIALIGQRIQNDFREAQRRESLLLAAYEAQASVVSDDAAKTIHYNILQREVDTNRQLYESLLQRVKEAGISSALRASNIQVIDPAVPPSLASSPNIRRGVLVGLFGGLFAGVGLVLLREQANRCIDGPGDAAFYLKAPELGVIPSRSMDRAGSHPRRLLGSMFREDSGDLALTTANRGQSLIAEAFRVALTSILFLSRKRTLNVITVSSPGPSEGKTTVLCNLAQAYAEVNRSVLVIDCDLRRPRLHDVFNVPNERGLVDLLLEKETLDAHSLFRHSGKSGISNLTVLTSGKTGAGVTNLLHSPRMRELIELARTQFDVVLIDTPPMLHLSDPRVVASLGDGVVLVVRSGKTSRGAALSARRQLVEDGTPLIGIALNDWNPRTAGYYSFQGYENYYSSYYKRQDQASGSGKL